MLKKSHMKASSFNIDDPTKEEAESPLEENKESMPIGNQEDDIEDEWDGNKDSIFIPKTPGTDSTPKRVLETKRSPVKKATTVPEFKTSIALAVTNNPNDIIARAPKTNETSLNPFLKNYGDRITL